MTKNRIHILYLEDDPSEIELAKLALKRACPKIETEFHVVTDGEEALVFLEKKVEHHRMPDLFMTDLRLPKISGLEIIRKAKELDHWKEIPVIVLTGSVSPAEQKELESLKISNIVMKPFDLAGYDKIFQDVCNMILSS